MIGVVLYAVRMDKITKRGKRNFMLDVGYCIGTLRRCFPLLVMQHARQNSEKPASPCHGVYAWFALSDLC